MDLQFLLEYEQFELRHWWHVARRRIITGFFDRYIPNYSSNSPRWLDVGCGTGVMLNDYQRITDKIGLEADANCVKRAQSKGLNVLQTGLEWNLEPYGQFDLISLCDVIEHVEHEQPAIKAVYDALKPGGILLVTVPALQSLWSSHDVINHHFRRYNRKQLLALFDHRQWDVLKCSYFCSFLLPMIWTFRKLKNFRERNSTTPPTHDNHFGLRWLDAILYAIFRSEAGFLRHVNLPPGSSIILVVCKK
ncbi:MAG: class I SAM-dependent methyltransferase [Phycisphaerales bacterium]|jgi:SAM-dependent methyltransferase|nr:class I SAM-dependent methyltransferase [Phycisphaerales bacterium]